MSNTPCASTTLRPLARAAAAISPSSPSVLILSNIDTLSPASSLTENARPIGLLPAEIGEPILRRHGDRIRRPYRCVAPIVYDLQHVLHAVFNRHFRRPAEFGLDPAGISVCAIRLPRPLGNMDRLGRLEELGQVVDRDRVVTADIEAQAYLARFGGTNQGIDGIRDIGEVARLLAVADDGERLAGQQLGQEDAEH